MRIVSSKHINFLVSNIFEKYYEPIQEELSGSGLAEEAAHKIKQEILAMIYRRAMDEGIETEEELDVMAVGIINERLERVLVPFYAQKYIDRFSLDKVALENGMLNRIPEKIEPRYTGDEFADIEIIDLENESPSTPVVRRMEEPRIRRFRINWMLTIWASVFVTIVLWFVVGMLMGRGYLPRVDMGYTWFNGHIWSIF